MSASDEKSSSEVFKRLRGYLKDYKLAFFIAILGNLIFAGMDFLFVYSLEPLTDEALVKNNMSTIEAAPYFVIGLLIVRGIASFISTYCMSWVGQNIVQKIQVQLAEKYVNLPSQYFDRVASGKLISKMAFDTQQVASAVTDAFTKLLRDGGLVIFIIAYIFYTNWQLASLFLISAPIIGLIVSYASKRFKKISLNIQNAMGGITQKTQEIVDGNKVIKTFNGESFEIEQFTVEAKQTRNLNIKMAATKAFSTPLIQLMAGFSLALVLYYAGKQLSSGELKPGEFVAMIGMMIMMLKPLKVISNLNSVLQKGIAAARSIFEVLDESREIDRGNKVLVKPKGKIEFKNISFAYSKKPENVINDISFIVEAGKTVALVGKSGSGKSTITNLLLRFYNQTNGQILLDGIDTEQLQLKNLRSHISLVSQQVTLFNSSVASNIAYPMSDKDNYDLERVMDAAKKAHAWEFIEKLENGFDENIGENGNRLSGGQRQRLAIARAIYKNSPIVILDEATSALDTESERHIQAALESLSVNKTSIVIAHRLSTIENADTIIVLNDGEIIETGSHLELIVRNGAYANLYKMQFAEQETN